MTFATRYPLTMWHVAVDYGCDMTASAPAMADPVAIFDDAVDQWAEARNDGYDAWVLTVNPHSDVTEEAANWLRTRLNNRRQEWPEWLAGPSERQISEDAAAWDRHERAERRFVRGGIA